jgi:hypothetical protein
LSIEEKKAKGKSVASKLWPSNFLSSSLWVILLDRIMKTVPMYPFFYWTIF